VNARGSAKVVVVLLGVVVVAGVSVALATGSELVVEDSEGEKLLSVPVEEGNVVSLEYTHSVEKTPVEDVYVVEDGRLVFNRTEFVSFGAGLPTEGIEVMDDGYVHRPDTERTGDVVVATGEVAGHELVVDGRRYDLTGMADGGTVHIRIEQGYLR